MCKVKKIIIYAFAMLSAFDAAWGVVSWDRMQKAAVESTAAVETWGMLLAAGVMYVSGADVTVSDWASENMPVFGSRENAQRWSDILAGGATAAQYASALAATPEESSGNAILTKLRYAATGFAANEFNYAVTGGLKGIAGRPRPDESGNNSFPSGHSSQSAVNVTLSLHILPSLPMTENIKPFIRGLLISLAVGTSWSRIEGKKHYPSDVLAGAAIGHWIGSFMSLYFFENSPFALSADSMKPGYTLQVQLLF